MDATEYIYYAVVPDGFTKEKPAGVWRAPKDNRLYLEALNRAGEWQFSLEVVKAFMTGDTLDVEEVSQEEGEKAVEHLLRVIRGRASNGKKRKIIVLPGTGNHQRDED